MKALDINSMSTNGVVLTECTERGWRVIEVSLVGASIEGKPLRLEGASNL